MTGFDETVPPDDDATPATDETAVGDGTERQVLTGSAPMEGAEPTGAEPTDGGDDDA